MTVDCFDPSTKKEHKHTWSFFVFRRHHLTRGLKSGLWHRFGPIEYPAGAERYDPSHLRVNLLLHLDSEHLPMVGDEESFV